MNKSNYDIIPPIFSFNINMDDNIIKFDNDYEYLINYIELISPTKKTDYKIKYKNQFTNSNFKTYLSGILDLDNKYHKNATKIYFNRPILASEINIIYNKDLSSVLSNKNSIKIYGKLASDNDIKTYKIESEITDNDETIALDSQKCPSMNDIITRQKLIKDLCNSISEKDKIRNHQTNYEKTKKYIAKLKQQEGQIQGLKNKLNNLLKDNNNNSLSFQEKTESIKEMIDNVNINNPFNTIDINYTDT